MRASCHTQPSYVHANAATTNVNAVAAATTAAATAAAATTAAATAAAATAATAATAAAAAAAYSYHTTLRLLRHRYYPTLHHTTTQRNTLHRTN